MALQWRQKWRKRPACAAPWRAALHWDWTKGASKMSLLYPQRHGTPTSCEIHDSGPKAPASTFIGFPLLAEYANVRHPLDP